MKFCRMVDIHDVITQVNFGDDRFRGLGVAGGQILAFPIDIDRRPYNTLALLCECVIYAVGVALFLCRRLLLDIVIVSCP